MKSSLPICCVLLWLPLLFLMGKKKFMFYDDMSGSNLQAVIILEKVYILRP